MLAPRPHLLWDGAVSIEFSLDVMLFARKTACLLLVTITTVWLGGVLAGAFLITADKPRKADAIIVIGGDHKPERVQRAVDLYQQGLAPIVIISAGTQVIEGKEHVPEAEVMRRQAMALGLPEMALLVENRSQSTFQNAYYVEGLCRERNIRSVLLVTSAYQSRRAAMIFREVFGATISVHIQPTYPNPLILGRWFMPDQVGVMLYEYYNWVRYWLGVRLPNEAPPTNTHYEVLCLLSSPVRSPLTTS